MTVRERDRRESRSAAWAGATGAGPSVRDDTENGFPGAAQVALVTKASETAARFAAWLVDVYGPARVCRETGTLGTLDGDLLVVSRQDLATDHPSRGHGGLQRDSCQVVATVAAEVRAAVVDDRVATPVGREKLLATVETARRVAVYEETVAELLSLTARRRTLRASPASSRATERPTVRRLSERIEDLHARIDDTLADVERRYPGLVASEKRRRPAARGDR